MQHVSKVEAQFQLH